MDEHRIEDALRAGPPDERPHRTGALARGLAARGAPPHDESTFRVTLRAQSTSHTAPLLAAAVALVLLVIVVAVVGSSPTPAPEPTSTSPSPIASTAAPGEPQSGQGAPVQLVDRWVGPVRSIAGLDKPATRAILAILGVGFRFDAGPGQPQTLFASTVTQEGPDVLRLTSLSPNLACQPFDEGTYRWSLSPSGTTLTLTAVSDACSERLAALPGVWIHTACREPAQDCLGPIEAGTYQSTEFDALDNGSAGQLTYTVPDGWANTSDHRMNYALRPAADYAADPGFDGNDTVSGVSVWAGTLASDQPTDCSAVPAKGVAATATAIASHIAQLDGLNVVDRGSTVIDGRNARVLDVSLAPTYATPCPWSSGDAFRSLIMFADAGADGGVQGLAHGESARILFVDVAPGRVVSIWIDGPAARFDELVGAATPIVQSFQFAGPSSTP